MCIGALFVLDHPDWAHDDVSGTRAMDEATLRVLAARCFIEIELTPPEVRATTHDAGRVVPALPVAGSLPSRAIDHPG